MTRSNLALIVLMFVFAGCKTARTPAPTDSPADPLTERLLEGRVPLFEGLGVYSHPIETKSPLAQAYFDQGLVLGFGFNHAEAARSFRYAQELDPECAMCFWGEALVLGPNINAKMEDADVPVAYRAILRAVELKSKASARHQAYIDALAERYGPEPLADRSPLDRAYADTMGEVARRYPNDFVAAALYAEALMDLHPWDFWRDDGTAQPWTPQITALLEEVLQHSPDHPLANHLYIHAVEASETPERALASAQRLEYLVPGAGHLVHMPSHIYIRVGDYHAASTANERAIRVDANYLAQCHAAGVYPLAYHPHNHHFLWMATTLEGRSADAIEAAWNVRQIADSDHMHDPGLSTLQHFYSIPYYALVTFGRWDDIRALESPGEALPYPRGVWHFAQGMAEATDGDVDDARDHLAEVREFQKDPGVAKVTVWDINKTSDLLAIAADVLAGRIAVREGRFEAAAEHFRNAIRVEDSLNYDEPPPWGQPVRRYLGDALIRAGDYTAAARAFTEDLEKFPRNGWALYGLATAFEKAGRFDEAREVSRHFEQAWRYADIELNAAVL